MENRTITYIGTESIYPHPNNPRKDLGELGELAESIRANGILQNLTVVSRDGGYTAVIGHRRLAAAKLAGLTEVPCVIAEMDIREQVATMLLENIQRSDLTVFEQAQGFQMMLDLGETVGGIAGRTGFSESTVRRRVSLLELDQEELRASVSRGATLSDYAELDKIKNPKTKNKVLEQIGTPNFRYTLQNAINNEQNEETRKKLLDALDSFAKRVDDTKGLKNVRYIYVPASQNFEPPEDANTRQYYYRDDRYNINLLVDADAAETEKSSREDEAQRERRERRERLDEISNLAFRLRYDFVRELTPAKAKKHAKAIMEFAACVLLDDGYSDFDEENTMEMLGLEYDEDADAPCGELPAAIAANPEKALLVAAYCGGGDSSSWRYYNYSDCGHAGHTDLDRIYDILGRMGYEISDEERALREGTHELFGGTKS